jgi:6,7-dimethyl-8-ribityllumazine synthase
MVQRRNTFAIVASQYNGPFVLGLVENAMRELEALAPGSTIVKYEVPGAFEIPLAVNEIAERGGVEAIIALGVIIQGETEHARFIAESCTRALLECSVRYRLPVIHEVLLVRDEAQARVRCQEPELNRGIEAARVAVKMIQSLNEIRGR